ncbi:hypothetical protein NT6N_03400 [Oceaniferula spumae]|uniref:Ice-binding protein C-terminal domain-containing protein n=1 Tax=Oceaniferula spumae TaxID=2979115 RepID=A0AAT9FH46_9BACT
MKKHLLIIPPIMALASFANAASISISFTGITNDANIINNDESSTIGLPGAETLAGNLWNNVQVKPGGAASDATTWVSNTQGGANIDVFDSSGADAGVDITSSGAFYSNQSNVSGDGKTLTGDGALMHQGLNFNSAESITLTGLAAWAPNGYRVIGFMDLGNNDRTFGVSMSDGGLSQTFWTNSDAGTDSDPDDDGVITWLESTATSSGDAVLNANYAVWGTFTGDTLTITGTDPGPRSFLNGMQIIQVPEPSSAALVALGSLALMFRRRK